MHNEINVVITKADSLSNSEKKEIREVISKVLIEIGCVADSEVEFSLERYISCKKNPFLSIKKILVNSVRVSVSISSNKGYRGYIIFKEDSLLSFGNFKDLMKSISKNEFLVNLGNNGSGYGGAKKKITSSTESAKPKKSTPKTPEKTVYSPKKVWGDKEFQELFYLTLEDSKGTDRLPFEFSSKDALSIFNNSSMRSEDQKLSTVSVTSILMGKVNEGKLQIVKTKPFKTFIFIHPDNYKKEEVKTDTSFDFSELDELLKKKEILVSEINENYQILLDAQEVDKKLKLFLQEAEISISKYKDLYKKMHKYFS